MRLFLAGKEEIPVRDLAHGRRLYRLVQCSGAEQECRIKSRQKLALAISIDFPYFGVRYRLKETIY